MPKFEANLFDVKSLKKLQRDIEEYRKSLDDKCELFVRRLAELGLPIIDARMAQASFTVDEKGIQSGADISHQSYIKITSLNGYAQADLIVEGKELLFIEFGSGIYYNGEAGSSKNPYGQKLGYVIGSYGKGHGKQKIWGYYDGSGDLVLTHGVEATMPMYGAWEEIYKNALKILKEVFGGG